MPRHHRVRLRLAVALCIAMAAAAVVSGQDYPAESGPESGSLRLMTPPDELEAELWESHARSTALSYTFADIFIPSLNVDNTEFGHALAANRSLAAIGAPADNEARPGAGAVYVFIATSNVTWSWSFVQKLFPSYESPGRFGTSVAVSESSGTVVASAIGSLSSNNTRAVVHVFTVTSGGNWLLRQLLWAQSPFEAFGEHLVMVADVLAVSAAAADNGAGCVYLYHRNQGGTFDLSFKLTASDSTADDMFGSSLTLYKAPPVYRLAVGAPGVNETRGAVYMFNIDPALAWWNETEQFIKPESLPGDYFGVRLSGYHTNRGEYFAASGILTQFSPREAAYISVYTIDNGTWLQADAVRVGANRLSSPFPIIPNAFSLRAGVLWIAASSITGAGFTFDTSLYRFLPTPGNITWSLAQELPTITTVKASRLTTAMTVADLSGTLFLGNGGDSVTTVTWMPPSTTPTATPSGSPSESPSPTTHQSVTMTPASPSRTSVPSATPSRTSIPNSQMVINKALEVSNIDITFLQSNPQYTSAFMAALRNDLARVTSLPNDAILVNGLATMTASVIVEYTIDTRSLGVPAVIAANLIDSLLGSNMMLLTSVVNELPAAAFTGPVVAGDAGFLRCVNIDGPASFNSSSPSPSTSASAVPFTPAGQQASGSHTTGQLVIVGAVPTIALLIVSTAWCWYAARPRRQGTGTTAGGNHAAPRKKWVSGTSSCDGGDAQQCCDCACHVGGASEHGGCVADLEGVAVQNAMIASLDDVGCDPVSIDEDDVAVFDGVALPGSVLSTRRLEDVVHGYMQRSSPHAIALAEPCMPPLTHPASAWGYTGNPHALGAAATGAGMFVEAPLPVCPPSRFADVDHKPEYLHGARLADSYPSTHSSAASSPTPLLPQLPAAVAPAITVVRRHVSVGLPSTITASGKPRSRLVVLPPVAEEHTMPPQPPQPPLPRR